MFALAADGDTGFDDTESAGNDAAVFAATVRSMRVRQRRKHRRRTRHNGVVRAAACDRVGASPAAAADGAAAAATTTTNGTIGRLKHATRCHLHNTAAVGGHWRRRRRGRLSSAPKSTEFISVPLCSRKKTGM